MADLRSLKPHRWFRYAPLTVMLVIGTLLVSAQADTPGVNDQPDITLPGTVSTTPGQSVLFSPSPVVSEPDVGAGNMEMEIDVSDLDGVGGRSVGDYGTFTWGLGTDVTSDIAVTTMSAINTALSSFTFNPAPGFAGEARIIFEIDDQGNTGTGGVLSRTRFIDIDVCAGGESGVTCATNNQPDVSLSSPAQTEMNTPLSITVSVSDIDVGTGDMEMEIDISDLDGVGGLSVPAGDYGTFSWGGGSGVTSDVELEGISTINGYLATFTYTPPPGFLGLARIVFEIDDQGNSGSEYPANVLSRTRFIDINVVEPAEETPESTPESTSEATLEPTAEGTGEPVPLPTPEIHCTDPVPAGAIQGRVLGGAAAYFNPDLNATTDIYLNAGTAWWIVGGRLGFYEVWISCEAEHIWVPAEAFSPNYDPPWFGAPLPDAGQPVSDST